jgi:hypothetical protein
MDFIHFVFDVVSAGAIVAASYFGMMIREKLGTIRESQLELRATLIAHQTQVKEDLTAANAKIASDLAVHTARDEEQIEAVNGKLDDIASQSKRMHGENSGRLAVMEQDIKTILRNGH